MNYLITFILIIFFLFIELYNNLIEKYRSPMSKDNSFLQKCFDINEIDNFKKYYNKTQVTEIDNGIVFLTPNKDIDGIPHISWNGLFLNNLCIDPNHRNKGIGSKLVSKSIKESRKQGKDHIILQVDKENKNAIKI